MKRQADARFAGMPRKADLGETGALHKNIEGTAPACGAVPQGKRENLQM
jgi:hypothetical protein